MGFLPTSIGVGFTDKVTTPSISAITTTPDIYNYNTLVVHYSRGGSAATVADSTLTLTQNGCYHNGQPQWDFADGDYDGNYTTWTHNHRWHRHVHDGRFGSAVCEGQSHKLRMGNNNGWEFVTHGHISSWTTAATLNMFSIQGSGNTADGTAGVGNGGWINRIATDDFPYGVFRLGTNSIGAKMLGSWGLTGITTDGVINQ